MRLIAIILVGCLALSAAECEKLEQDFAALDSAFRVSRSLSSASRRYDYYYRYIAAGTDLMAWCRNDQRKYAYTEIVRKLRIAERERKGIHQSVIREQWQIHHVKPIVNIVYRECTY